MKFWRPGLYGIKRAISNIFFKDMMASLGWLLLHRGFFRFLDFQPFQHRGVFCDSSPCHSGQSSIKIQTFSDDFSRQSHMLLATIHFSWWDCMSDILFVISLNNVPISGTQVDCTLCPGIKNPVSFNRWIRIESPIWNVGCFEMEYRSIGVMEWWSNGVVE